MDASTSKKIDTPENSLDFEKSILYSFGIYPIYGEKYTGNKLIYRTKLITTFAISITFTLSIWLNVFYNLDDSSVVIETLYFGLTQTTYISKLFNLHLRFKSFKSVERFLNHPDFNYYTPEQYKFFMNALKNCRLFANVFRIAVTITILFFCVFPFLDHGLLPLPSYFPMSIEKYRFVLFPYQMIGIIMNGYCHSSMDCIVCTLITIGSAQFQILKDNLQNMRHGLDDVFENRDENDAVVAKRLRQYVHHHVTIIRYVNMIENAFSFVQFVQFLASSIIICVTGFQIIVTPITDLKFITLTLYFACNLIQVSMCCWFGHEIMDESEGVGEACYMSDWYNCGLSVCRTLFIIMERSKRPVTLTAGKFFDLTLQTLMQVLKTSYSYLALLQRMNEVGEL